MSVLKKIKKSIWILFLGIGFINAEVNEDILAEFDVMASMARKDIQLAVYGGLIPADIAITSFGVYGFTPEEKQYFEEVMNKIFYTDISFKLITIPESQTIQVEEIGEKVIIKKGASKNSDLKRYAESINSRHYGEIFIYSMTDRIFMMVLVHDANTGDVVWKKDWAIKRDDRFTAEVGYLMGYSFSSGNIYHYIHSFFGARAVGLGEFGVSLDVGGSHALSALSGAGISISEIGEVDVSILLSPKVSINILELIGKPYIGVDVYGIVKPGLRMDMLVYSTLTTSDPNLFYKPDFFFAANLGVGVGLKRVNIEVSIDVVPTNGFLLTGGLYYKF